ncbi:MAG TPA: SpoIIE family protein phosphatase, partial [Cytophagaceae bacterium]|nr:SpoIIE family protein phosphatase [Cytophagaceae bacterium]
MVEDTKGNRDSHLRQMKLDSLLEVTKAINANLPEASLYKIYHFTLLAGLEIKKLALFVKESTWTCKVHFGVDAAISKEALPSALQEIQAIQKVNLSGLFKDLGLAIPVKHKDKILAILLLEGKTKEEEQDTSFIQTFTNITLVAIENKRLARLNLEQEALKKEIEIAKKVQQNLIPAHLPQTDALKIFASYYPNKIVGGDYYDYIPLDDHRFYVCMADVSGKGIPAALLMSNFQACLRTLVLYTSDLKDIISRLNEQVYNHTKGEKFITVFLAYIDIREKIIRCVNAGHNPPLLMEGEKHQWLDKGTCILGMFEKLPFIEEMHLAMPSKVRLFAYTDGVSEVMNNRGEEFGQEGLFDFISSAKEISDAVHLELYD